MWEIDDERFLLEHLNNDKNENIRFHVRRINLHKKFSEPKTQLRLFIGQPQTIWHVSVMINLHALHTHTDRHTQTTIPLCTNILSFFRIKFHSFKCEKEDVDTSIPYTCSVRICKIFFRQIFRRIYSAVGRIENSKIM